jgi:hypothetical protein
MDSYASQVDCSTDASGALSLTPSLGQSRIHAIFRVLSFPGRLGAEPAGRRPLSRLAADRGRACRCESTAVLSESLGAFSYGGQGKGLQTVLSGVERTVTGPTGGGLARVARRGRVGGGWERGADRATRTRSVKTDESASMIGPAAGG